MVTPPAMIAVIQSQDEWLKESSKYEKRLLSYGEVGLPAKLNGAWRAHKPGEPLSSNGIYYFTARRRLWVNELNDLCSLAYARNPFYEWSGARHTVVNPAEWSFMANSMLYKAIDGNIRIHENRKLEVRFRPFRGFEIPAGEEVVEIYERVLPRPGPFFADYDDSLKISPPELIGSWSTTAVGSASQQIEITHPVGKPISIRFMPPLEITGWPELLRSGWDSTEVVYWEPGVWWLRGAKGRDAIEMRFEVRPDGTLQIVPRDPEDCGSQPKLLSPLPLFSRLK